MRGSFFLRRTSLAAIPTASRSSELKKSRASCCVMPISLNSFYLRSLKRINRIALADDSFAQHRAINAKAVAVLFRDQFANFGRSDRGRGVQSDDSAP